MFDEKLLYLIHSNNSKIKKISPFIKLVCLLLSLITIIITSNIYILGLMLVFSIFLMYKINIDITFYIKKIMKSLIFIVIISVIYLLFSFNFISFLYIFSKLFILSIYLFFIIFTTTLKELYNGLCLLLKPLNNINIKSEKISLKIVKYIYLINLLFKVNDEIKESIFLKIRGNLNLKDKLFLIKIYIKCIFVKVKYKYKNIEDYLKVKNYNINSKNKYNLFFNIMFLIIHVIILIIAVLCEVLV